jgi:hypothetical protein
MWIFFEIEIGVQIFPLHSHICGNFGSHFQFFSGGTLDWRAYYDCVKWEVNRRKKKKAEEKEGHL